MATKVKEVKKEPVKKAVFDAPVPIKKVVTVAPAPKVEEVETPNIIQVEEPKFVMGGRIKFNDNAGKEVQGKVLNEAGNNVEVVRDDNNLPEVVPKNKVVKV